MTDKPGVPAVGEFACPTCLQPAGSRCVTATGNLTTPHIQRWRLGEGWLAGAASRDADVAAASETATEAGFNAGASSRQGEVDELAGELRASAAEIVGLNEQATLITRDLEATRLERDVANKLAAKYAADILTLQRRVDELTKPVPVPAPTSKTFFGSCPPKPGGATIAAQQKVIDKWGKGAAVRTFINVGISTVAVRHPDAGIVHVSWKERNAANLTPEKVKAAVAALRDGDVVEILHESDNDGLAGQALTDRMALKSTFYDVVKQVRPGLLVAHTMTGWAFEPKSGKAASTEAWVAGVRADVLGVDCDGIRPTSLPYTDYKAETKAALALVAKHADNGYQWIAVPEFGCPRIPSADPDGKVRAAYHDEHAALWKASGKCLYVTLYEFDSSPNYSLTTSAEISGWKSLVA